MPTDRPIDPVTGQKLSVQDHGIRRLQAKLLRELRQPPTLAMIAGCDIPMELGGIRPAIDRMCDVSFIHDGGPKPGVESWGRSAKGTVFLAIVNGFPKAQGRPSPPLQPFEVSAAWSIATCRALRETIWGPCQVVWRDLPQLEYEHEKAAHPALYMRLCFEPIA